MVIGLTGGICTGKSTVAAIFREQGAHVIDADELAHGAIQKGGAAYSEIVRLFGQTVVGPDGEIDRKKLGAVVFRDASLRGKLEDLVHPEVFRMFEESRDRILSEQRNALILFNAALLIETGYHSRMDKIVVVYAPEQEQLRRLIHRDSLSPAEAWQRIRAQIPIEAKKPLAHHVIDNSGSLSETSRQVEALLRELRWERLS